MPGVQTCADRKSTRLNSSHTIISYAAFCLKKQPDRLRGGFFHGAHQFYRCKLARSRQFANRVLFFFNDTAPTEIYPLSLHDALPICEDQQHEREPDRARVVDQQEPAARSEEHTSELQSHDNLVCRLLLEKKKHVRRCSADRRHPGRHGQVAPAPRAAYPEKGNGVFFLRKRPPPSSSLFPYPSLFR